MKDARYEVEGFTHPLIPSREGQLLRLNLPTIIRALVGRRFAAPRI